ncbi:MAG: helix-turn-helix domain-containing protein [Oscillospiraceae bacterium]
MSLGLKLRQIRKRKKLSQIEVAEKSKMSAVNSIPGFTKLTWRHGQEWINSKVASAHEIDVAELLETKPAEVHLLYLIKWIGSVI